MANGILTKFVKFLRSSTVASRIPVNPADRKMIFCSERDYSGNDILHGGRGREGACKCHLSHSGLVIPQCIFAAVCSHELSHSLALCLFLPGIGIFQIPSIIFRCLVIDEVSGPV